MLLSWLLLLPLVGLACVNGAAVQRGAEIQRRGKSAPLTRRGMPPIKNYSDADKKTITTAFKDLATMLWTVQSASDTDTWLDVLGKYFCLGDDDDCQKTQEVSTGVWQMMANIISSNPGSDGLYLSPTMESILIDGDDPHKDPDAVAYMIDQGEKSPSTMHIGPIGLKQPLLEDMSCDQLGDRVSLKMISLASKIFHELTHSYEIARNVIGLFHQCPLIVSTDLKVGGRQADDPGIARVLAQGLQRDKAVCNAGSYEWFLDEMYWTIKCKKSFGNPA